MKFFALFTVPAAVVVDNDAEGINKDLRSGKSPIAISTPAGWKI